MTREKEIKQATNEFISKFPFIGTRSVAFEYGAQWADEHPKSQWHKMGEELPALDPTMASRGLNMSLPCLLCDIDNLTSYAGTRYHYDPARYDFDKKQWQDVIGVYDDEIGITHTHWMYEPEPPKGGKE